MANGEKLSRCCWELSHVFRRNPNKSGKGFNITWEYLPLGDGATVMLPYDKRHDGYQLVPDEHAA